MKPGNNPETSRGAQHPIFPLSEDLIKGCISTFSGFGEKDLALINASNLHLLPPDDPDRFALELGMRPDVAIQGSQAQQLSYRAGICLGLVVIRKAIKERQGDAGDSKEAPPSFDVARAREMVWARQTARQKRSPGPMTQVLHEFPAVYDFSGFFEFPDSVAYIGALKARWMKSGVITPAAVKEDADDFISFGLKDVFALYSWLYGENTQPKNDNFLYDPKRHFLRTDPRRQRNAPVQLTRFEYELDPEDLDPEGAENQNLSIFRERTPECGFVGHRSVKYRGDGRWRKEVMDTWWQDDVPYGTVITRLRSFLGGHVAHPAENGRIPIIPVGFEDTVRDRRLTERDTIIVKGAEGRYFSLTAPFHVGRDVVDEHDLVKLVVHARNGVAVPLTDLQKLDENERMLLGGFTQEICSIQAGRSGRRASSFILKQLSRPTVPVIASTIPPIIRYVSSPNHVSAGQIAIDAAYCMIFGGTVMAMGMRHRKNQLGRQHLMTRPLPKDVQSTPTVQPEDSQAESE